MYMSELVCQSHKFAENMNENYVWKNEDIDGDIDADKI